jgi:hypothetical protein
MITVRSTNPDAFSWEARRWCQETFGLPCQGKPRKECKWTDIRWAMYDTFIRFQREEDAVLFTLKWI